MDTYAPPNWKSKQVIHILGRLYTGWESQIRQVVWYSPRGLLLYNSREPRPAIVISTIDCAATPKANSFQILSSNLHVLRSQHPVVIQDVLCKRFVLDHHCLQTCYGGRSILLWLPWRSENVEDTSGPRVRAKSQCIIWWPTCCHVFPGQRSSSRQHEECRQVHCFGDNIFHRGDGGLSGMAPSAQTLAFCAYFSIDRRLLFRVWRRCRQIRGSVSSEDGIWYDLSSTSSHIVLNSVTAYRCSPGEDAQDLVHREWSWGHQGESA